MTKNQKESIKYIGFAVIGLLAAVINDMDTEIKVKIVAFVIMCVSIMLPYYLFGGLFMKVIQHLNNNKKQ